MRWFPTLCLTLLAFCLGLIVGLRTKSGNSAPIFTNASTATVGSTTVRNKLADTSAPTATEPQDSWGVQARTFAELSNRKEGLIVRPVAGDKLDIGLVLMLGLTTDEWNRINRSILETRTQIEHLRLATAVSTLSKDGKKTIITLPPLANEVDPIYKSLISTLSTVLGPEKYNFFNKVAGDSLDQMYDNFGANEIIYEIANEPTANADGTKVYAYRRSSFASVGGAGSWSSSKAELGKIDDPLLRGFLPPK
ncbi:MAG TPA: hypothetical protein VGM64_11320 [Lacunisphaera sp.]|jgi:hypothetical protein